MSPPTPTILPSPPPGAPAGDTPAPLQPFLSRALPALLRRMNCWKGLRTDAHHDLIEDLRQELRLDCLQNADVVANLAPEQRHSRWFRLVERYHYRLRERPSRYRGDVPVHALTAPDRQVASGPGGLAGSLTLSDRTLLQRLLQHACYFRNGRLNVQATARSMNMTRTRMRKLLDRLASAADCGSEFLQFYEQRLVEALVGFAADLLRLRGDVRLLFEEQRRRPDPLGRIQRIQRIHRRLKSRPIPRELRRLLRPYCARPRQSRQTAMSGFDPLDVLDHASRLAPELAAVHLWSFEAAVARGLLHRSAHHLREARRCRADPVAVVLARARLLEARGCLPRARRLLERAANHRPRDARLRRASQHVSLVTKAG